VSTYDFLGLLHTSLELGDIPLRLIFRQLIDFIFSDYAQRLLCVEFPLTYMPCIGGACRGHHVRESARPRFPEEAEARLAGWLAGHRARVQAVSVSQHASQAVEAGQNGCR